MFSRRSFAAEERVAGGWRSEPRVAASSLWLLREKEDIMDTIAAIAHMIPLSSMMTTGYGSIPINTIFSGMNIHKTQLFWCELQGYQGFDPSPYDSLELNDNYRNYPLITDITATDQRSEASWSSGSSRGAWHGVWLLRWRKPVPWLKMLGDTMSDTRQLAEINWN